MSSERTDAFQFRGLRISHLSRCFAVWAARPYKEAVENYQHKQYDQALALAEQALRANGNNPAYLHLYGSILATVGRLDSAEEYLRKAAAIAPDQPLYAYELGAL